MLIGSPQSRHLPRRSSQLSTGTLSLGRIGRSHPGQCEGGRTTDSPLGTRQMTTLRKEPTASPRTTVRITRASMDPSYRMDRSADVLQPQCRRDDARERRIAERVVVDVRVLDL